MSLPVRFLIALVGLAAMAAGASVASAKPATERLFTLQPNPAGNPEGVAYDKRSKAFFVSITAGGAIYRGTLDSDTVSPFIAGDGAAIGLEIRRGKLYVAGGDTGSIKVYDIDTGALEARFETGAGGFLNDLVVTGRGDVYVTDSLRPTLWHVTAEQVEAGSGTPQALDVSAIPYDAGFNVNGIVNKGSRRLVVVDSNGGGLYRIKLSSGRDSIREISQIEGATAEGGDGLILDRGRLVAVLGDAEELAFYKLRSSARKATLVDTRTSELFERPSTVARAKRHYLVVNADFNDPDLPFTVAGIPRHAGH
jgi:Cu-Zn family superoxide dismutase